MFHMNGEWKNFAYMWTLYILTKILVKMGKMGFIVYGNNSVLNGICGWERPRERER